MTPLQHSPGERKRERGERGRPALLGRQRKRKETERSERVRRREARTRRSGTKSLTDSTRQLRCKGGSLTIRVLEIDSCEGVREVTCMHAQLQAPKAKHRSGLAASQENNQKDATGISRPPQSTLCLAEKIGRQGQPRSMLQSAVAQSVWCSFVFLGGASRQPKQPRLLHSNMHALPAPYTAAVPLCLVVLTSHGSGHSWPT